MKIAHGLFVWQEPQEALEACLRSTVPYVDEVIIADCLIDGVPDLGLPWHTDLAWLAEPSDWLPDHIAISSRASGLHPPSLAPWPSLSAACTWILGKARQLGCEWLLYIDADQELHNGIALRPTLEAWPTSLVTYSIGRQDKTRHPCPWQCVHVPSLTRYVAGCYIVELADGSTVNLVPDEAEMPVMAGAPWISHHPERRPPWRRHQRLGEFETILEPPPPRVPSVLLGDHLLQVPVMSTSSPVAPEWYCPGCGTRYFGPGMCVNGHAAIELALDETAASDAAATASGEATVAAGEPPTSVTAFSSPGPDAPPAAWVAATDPDVLTPAAATPAPETSAVAQALHHIRQAFDLLAGL